MLNMEEVLSQIPTKLTRDRTTLLFISKFHLNYAYVEMKISDEISRQCVFALTREQFSGYYRFKKEF